VRIEIKMAQLGYDMETGTILTWLKAIGDSVERGDSILEVETDKGAVEMETVASGVLVEIVHQEGDVVPVVT
jgi:pyruvate dehydrogenase E2 component (dihydrolipoamide acetyltransferase)